MYNSEDNLFADDFERAIEEYCDLYQYDYSLKIFVFDHSRVSSKAKIETMLRILSARFEFLFARSVNYEIKDMILQEVLRFLMIHLDDRSYQLNRIFKDEIEFRYKKYRMKAIDLTIKAINETWRSIKQVEKYRKNLAIENNKEKEVLEEGIYEK